MSRQGQSAWPPGRLVVPRSGAIADQVAGDVVAAHGHLEIIENRDTQRPLADGSKTLHRLLPNLVPPIGAVGYKTVSHPTMPVAGPDRRRPRSRALVIAT